MKANKEEQYPLPMGFPLENFPMQDNNEPVERRLLKEVTIKSYEEYDTTGERRVRVETHTKVFFDNDDTRHNPTKTYTVEYL
tara:strand:+ start:49 stop:294 length:246 start_codon:yes stop_codon:yes gene_type:complete